MIDTTSSSKTLAYAQKMSQLFKNIGRQQDACRIDQLIRSAEDMRFLIGVVGQAKRGKSTLINGLLGRSDDMLAPIDRFPATNVISVFANGSQESARIYFRKTPDTPTEILLSQIKNYACEEFNPANQKEVERIEIIARCPLLQDDVVLVDTPGADNALSALHDTVLMDVLPRLDVLLFLTDAGEPLVDSEITLLKQIKNSDKRKILFIMNKIDKLSPDELSQGIQHNQKKLAELGCSDIPVFTISAKQFLKTKEDKGIREVFHAIQQIIEKDKIQIVTDRIYDTVTSIKDSVLKDLQTELVCIEHTDEEINADIEKLDALKFSLSQGQLRQLEIQFKKNWTPIFSDYFDFLEEVKNETIAEYDALIEQTGFISLGALAKTVHTDIAKRIDDKAGPYLQKMQANIETTINLLISDYESKLATSFSAGAKIKSDKDLILDSVSIVASGTMPALGALALGSLPGLVSSAILSSAPTATAFAWGNFGTWIPAVAAGVGGAAAGSAATTAITVLTPIAWVGMPILIGYSGMSIYKAWNYKKMQTKNDLLLGCKKLIAEHIYSMKSNIGQIQQRDNAIIEQFYLMQESRLLECKNKLEKIKAQRPAPEQVVKLKKAVLLLSSLKSEDLKKNSNPESLFAKPEDTL